MVYCIGLTGGIGCGKSSAAEIFAGLGADIIDTDAIAHRLSVPETPVVVAIAEQFGANYLLPDGSLDRAKIRKLVFSDAPAKKRLEAILHPRIKFEVEKALACSQAPYVVAVIPLLLESGNYETLVRRTLVVDCEEAQQKSRAMVRSQLTRDEVCAIMAAQLKREDRLAQADDIVKNIGGIAELQRQIENLHALYLRLAAASSAKK